MSTNTKVVPISLENLEFVVPENLLKVVSLMDCGSELSFPSTQICKTRRISVDKDLQGNVTFKVHSGKFQVLPKGLKCVIRDITNTLYFNREGEHLIEKKLEQSQPFDDSEHSNDSFSHKSNKFARRDVPQGLSSADNLFSAKGEAEEPDEQSVCLTSSTSCGSFEASDDVGQSVHKDSSGVSQAKENVAEYLNDETRPSDKKLQCLKRVLNEVSKLSAESRRRVNQDDLDTAKTDNKSVKGADESASIEKPCPCIELDSAMQLRSRGRLKKTEVSPSEDSRTDLVQNEEEKANIENELLSRENTSENLDSQGPRSRRKCRLSKNPTRNWKKNIQCRLCNRWVKTYVILYDHVQRLHTLHPEMESYRDEIKLKQVTCEVCKETLPDGTDLKVHMKNVHSVKRHEGSRDYCCHECNKSFLDPKCLRNHIQRVHPKVRLLCHLCPASFKTKQYLKEHIEAVHEKKVAFVCGICGKKFMARSSWVRHKAYHDNTKYNCQYCGRGFTEKANMVRHVRYIHDVGKSRKVNCEHCGKEFSSVGNLKQHVKTIHLKEFTFKCDVCGKGFLRNRHLQEHIEIHDNLKCESTTKTDSVTMEPLRVSSTSMVNRIVEGKPKPESRSMYIVFTSSDALNQGPQVVHSPQIKTQEPHAEEQTPGVQLQETQIMLEGDQVLSDFNFQQILDLAQLGMRPDQQVQLQDIPPDLLNLSEGVEIHIPQTDEN